MTAASASASVMHRHSSFVIDATTGRVLHADNADAYAYPASLTKMMTLYLLFDALDHGRIGESDRIKFSYKASRQPPSHLGLAPGSTISVHDAILALVTKSANDVAVAVGETLGGGSERSFARAMTHKARELGMTRTTFRNASGLYNHAQMSTARDMATLARHLLHDFPQYYRFFSTEAFHYDGETFKNHNELMSSYHGMDGIKTGFLSASGFNLVASAKRDGHRLIGVIFGGRTARRRNAHMARLLDQAFHSEGISIAQAPPRQASRQAKANGAYGIQVGAYSRHNPAYEAAYRAVARASRYLSDGAVAVAPTQYHRHKPRLYRARIVGISKHEAYRACAIIKHARFAGCMVFKRGDEQVADAGN